MSLLDILFVIEYIDYAELTRQSIHSFQVPIFVVRLRAWVCPSQSAVTPCLLQESVGLGHGYGKQEI